MTLTTYNFNGNVSFGTAWRRPSAEILTDTSRREDEMPRLLWPHLERFGRRFCGIGEEARRLPYTGQLGRACHYGSAQPTGSTV